MKKAKKSGIKQYVSGGNIPDTSGTKTGEEIGAFAGLGLSALGVPPGIGSAIGGLVGGAIGSSFNSKPKIPVTQNTNPYGQFKNGGSIHINPANKGKFNATKARTGKTTEELTHSKNPLTRKRAVFALNASHFKHENGGDIKQYNAPTHEQGGQMIDQNMNPTNNPNIAVGEIEKNENSNGSYIYSDTLGLGNKTFAQLAKKINDKYKNSNDAISQKSKELELNQLKQKNEILRQQVEQSEVDKFALGGYLDKGEPVSEYDPNTIKPYLPSIHPETTEPLNYSNGFLNNVNVTPNKTQLLDYTKLTGISKLDNTPNTDITTTNKGINYLNTALGLKGTAFASKLLDAFQPVEQEKLQLNPEANKVKDLMSKRSIDTTALSNANNLERNAALANTQNARSVNVQRALNSNIFSDSMQKQMQANLQAQQLNNGYRGEEAQLRNNLGQQEAAEKIRQQNIQSQNNAAKRGFVRDALIGDVSKIGDQMLNMQNYQDTLKNNKEIANLSQEEAMRLLSYMGNNYDINKEANGTWSLKMKTNAK